MKVFLFSLLFFSTIGCQASSSHSAYSEQKSFTISKGVVNGGGGKAIRCGDTIKLLDLYESELKGYPAPNTSDDFETDFKNYTYKIARQLANPGVDVDEPVQKEKSLQSAKKQLKEMIDIPAGEKLDFTNDATLPALPVGCSFVQVAVNTIEMKQNAIIYTIYRDKELWNLMSPIHQVALSMHEFIYAATRIFHAEINSDDTRVLISRMFSGLDTHVLFDSIRNSKSLTQCTFLNFNPNQPILDVRFSGFYAVPEIENGVSGLGIYFSVINSKILTTRTRSFIAGIAPVNLINVSNISLKSVIKNELLQRKWQMQLNTNSKNELTIQVTEEGQSAVSNPVRGFCKSSLGL